MRYEYIPLEEYLIVYEPDTAAVDSLDDTILAHLHAREVYSQSYNIGIDYVKLTVPQWLWDDRSFQQEFLLWQLKWID